MASRRRRSAVQTKTIADADTEVMVPKELYKPFLALLAVAGLVVIGNRIYSKDDASSASNDDSASSASNDDSAMLAEKLKHDSEALMRDFQNHQEALKQRRQSNTAARNVEIKFSTVNETFEKLKGQRERTEAAQKAAEEFLEKATSKGKTDFNELERTLEEAKKALASLQQQKVVAQTQAKEMHANEQQLEAGVNNAEKAATKSKSISEST